MNFKKLFNLALPLLLLSSAVVGMAPQPSYQDFVTALNLFRGRQDNANASKLIGAYNNLNPSNKKRANQAAAIDLTKAQALLSPTRQPQVDAQAEAQRIAQEQAAAQAEAQRLAQQQAEAQRLAQQQTEAQRIAQQQAEARRRAEEQAAREAAQAEAQRIAQQQAEARRRAEEQAAREAAQAEAQRIAQQQAEARRRAEEQAAREAAQAEAQRLAQQEEARRLAEEQAAREAAQAEAQRIAQIDALIATFPNLNADALKTQMNLVLRDQRLEDLTRKVAVAFQAAINNKKTDSKYAELVDLFNAKIDAIRAYDLSNLRITIEAPSALPDLTIEEIEESLVQPIASFKDEARDKVTLEHVKNSLLKLTSDPKFTDLKITFNNKINALIRRKNYKFNDLLIA